MMIFLSKKNCRFRFFFLLALEFLRERGKFVMEVLFFCFVFVVFVMEVFGIQGFFSL